MPRKSKQAATTRRPATKAISGPPDSPEAVTGLPEAPTAVKADTAKISAKLAEHLEGLEAQARARLEAKVDVIMLWLAMAMPQVVQTWNLARQPSKMNGAGPQPQAGEAIRQ
jgi:hypothetical protein